jgi:hypothetical protein
LEIVHADAGTIFDSAPFKEWCKQEGRKASVVLATLHRPQQNGLTENRWQQVQKTASNMLAHVRLDECFQDRVLIYAATVINLHPLNGLLDEERRPCTPFYKYYGKKPNLARLRVFGCPVVFKVFSQNSGRLHEKNLPQVYGLDTPSTKLVH